MKQAFMLVDLWLAVSRLMILPQRHRWRHKIGIEVSAAVFSMTETMWNLQD